jgi:hypothetical protein
MAACERRWRVGRGAEAEASARALSGVRLMRRARLSVKRSARGRVGTWGCEHWAVAVRAVSGEGTNWAERERRERARAGRELLGPRGKEWGWVEGEWAVCWEK